MGKAKQDGVSVRIHPHVIATVLKVENGKESSQLVQLPITSLFHDKDKHTCFLTVYMPGALNTILVKSGLKK